LLVNPQIFDSGAKGGVHGVIAGGSAVLASRNARHDRPKNTNRWVKTWVQQRATLR
jgi:hypothetical protein